MRSAKKTLTGVAPREIQTNPLHPRPYNQANDVLIITHFSTGSIWIDVKTLKMNSATQITQCLIHSTSVHVTLIDTQISPLWINLSEVSSENNLKNKFPDSKTFIFRCIWSSNPILLPPHPLSIWGGGQDKITSKIDPTCLSAMYMHFYLIGVGCNRRSSH